MSYSIFDFQTGGATVASGAASASTTLPGNNTGAQQTYAVACTQNCHIRIGKGAQTAVATDPLLISTGGIYYITVPAGADTIAAIQDGVAGNVTVWRVFEA